MYNTKLYEIRSRKCSNACKGSLYITCTFVLSFHKSLYYMTPHVTSFMYTHKYFIPKEENFSHVKIYCTLSKITPHWAYILFQGRFDSAVTKKSTLIFFSLFYSGRNSSTVMFFVATFLLLICQRETQIKNTHVHFILMI